VNKEQIKYLLTEQLQMRMPELLPRRLEIPYGSGKIISLIGIRRVGKTFLLYHRINELLSQQIDRRQIIYLNFEDDRLGLVKSGELDLILKAHYELYPDLQNKPRYYFFDEIQNAKGWERFCRRIYDTENAQIVVTGSSSQFLAKEISTELRGRSLPIEVFPLSFKEFLDFRAFKFEPYSVKSEGQAVAELEQYLEIGGLPEVVLASPQTRPLILKEYIDLMYYRDLLDRHRISNPIVMKELLRFCLSSPASLVNVAKLFQDMKSRGLKVSKNTLYRYLQLLEEAYFVFLLPIHDRSLRKQAINPKKMHPIDWSLGLNYLPGRLLDRGRRLETAVFLHNRRLNSNLSYQHSPTEIDLIDSESRPEKYTNVCWSLQDQTTLRREVAQFDGIKASKASRILVAHEIGNSSKVPSNIEIVEAWRYLLF